MIELDDMVRVTLPDGHTWLERKRYFRADDYTDEYPGVTFDHAPTATGLELAELIARDLESANYHSLVSFPRQLHKIVEEAAGIDAADKVLEVLYQNSTLQNLY